MASLRNSSSSRSHFSLYVLLLFLLFLHSSFQVSPCPSLPFPLHLTHFISLSVPSLFSFFFYLIFPPLLLFLFFTHAHIQIRFNFELCCWRSNQKGLTSRNKTWSTKWTNCSYRLPFVRFYSEDRIFHLPKTGFRPQERVRGKSSGLKSYIFCFFS